jgi:hypothetical protein
MSRLVVGAVLILAACTTPPPVDLESADMRGIITTVTPDGRYLVESPVGAPGVGKCVVRVTSETELVRADGTAIELPLAAGADVSVWFTGPVMKSYPAQATAAKLYVHTVSR